MFPDSFQIGQLKNDTRFSEGVNLDSESALNDLLTVSLVQTTNSQASMKLFCVRELLLLFFYFFSTPQTS